MADLDPFASITYRDTDSVDDSTWRGSYGVPVDITTFSGDDSAFSVTMPVMPKLRKAITLEKAPHRGRTIPDVWVDDSRDALLKPFAKDTMDDRYLSPGETYQDRFANCVRYYADDQNHAQRMYEYISKLWCMPPTPILSNGGTLKGNLISCYLNSMEDSLESISSIWTENVWLGSKGGGIGTYIGNIRGIGEKAGLNGKTSGAISFAKVIDALVACISQGSNRRGAGAVYLKINHPEIDSFLEMRRPAGGDPDRKTLNLHHGVLIDDKFMNAAINGEEYELISPHTGEVIERVNARHLAEKLVTTRLETGEPYIIFEDNVNKYVPEHHKRSGLYPTTSNLCSEITLPTGPDHHGNIRTAVCCLFQPNAEKFEEWSQDPMFFKDIGCFLDNVLQDFIDHGGEEFVRARYAASRERSIGVGMMGWHSFLQMKDIALDSVMAKVWNMKIFGHMKKEMDRVSQELAEERGACPDAAEHGIMERFSYKTAIAPTASVSIICSGPSAGVDVIPANIYTHKTLSGSYEVKNPWLEVVLEKYGKNTDVVWSSILNNQGSVQHLEFLTDHERNVYKTSFEVDQRYHLELAADRTPLICQSQSINITLEPDCYKYDLWKLHELAWRKGVKSLYYLRSMSIQKVDSSEGNYSSTAEHTRTKIDYDECLSCQ